MSAEIQRRIARALKPARFVPPFASDDEEAAWYSEHDTYHVPTFSVMDPEESSPPSFGRITFRLFAKEIEELDRRAALLAVDAATYVRLLISHHLFDEMPLSEFEREGTPRDTTAPSAVRSSREPAVQKTDPYADLGAYLLGRRDEPVSDDEADDAAGADAPAAAIGDEDTEVASVDSIDEAVAGGAIDEVAPPPNGASTNGHGELAAEAMVLGAVAAVAADNDAMDDDAPVDEMVVGAALVAHDSDEELATVDSIEPMVASDLDVASDELDRAEPIAIDGVRDQPFAAFATDEATVASVTDDAWTAPVVDEVPVASAADKDPVPFATDEAWTAPVLDEVPVAFVADEMPSAPVADGAPVSFDNDEPQALLGDGAAPMADLDEDGDAATPVAGLDGPWAADSDDDGGDGSLDEEPEAAGDDPHEVGIDAVERLRRYVSILAAPPVELPEREDDDE